MEKDTKQAKCAQCKKNFDRTSTPKDLWPFCSKRCKMIDLGQWLSEKYVIEEGEEKDSVEPLNEEDNNE